MASENASRLKADWTEMPAECFETLTFGELKVGQKFIVLPLPGDNSGHGGFRGTHYIFTKTKQSIDRVKSARRYGVLLDLPGTAVDSRGIASNFPDLMPVIFVE